MSEMSTPQCWISEKNGILSFHAMPDSKMYEFKSRDEMMQFVIVSLAGKGYRVQ